jgi:hypothetical protein
MGSLTVIGEYEALKIRRQWEREVAPKVDQDSRALALVREVFQRVSEGRLDGEVASAKVQLPKRDLADKQRQWFEDWYRKLGFAITVPKPAVSNREFARRTKLGQFLVFRPSALSMTYHGFMAAVGQASSHWTITHDDRHKIVWEPTEVGYWFWAEVAADCPRLRTTWNSLNQAIHLLSLEEYVIVWHAYKAKTGQMLDLRTWSWLRTRFGAGALLADGYNGRVGVHGYVAEALSIPHDNGGGRAAEVVKNAP